MLSLRWNKKHSSWLLMTKFHWLLAFVDERERSKKFKSQTAHYWQFQPPFKPHNHKMSFIYLSLSIFRTEILDNATRLFNDIQKLCVSFSAKKKIHERSKKATKLLYVYIKFVMLLAITCLFFFYIFDCCSFLLCFPFSFSFRLTHKKNFFFTLKRLFFLVSPLCMVQAVKNEDTWMLVKMPK